MGCARRQAKAGDFEVIQKELYNFWELFTVITLDEYSDYIKGGISNESEESR